MPIYNQSNQDVAYQMAPYTRQHKLFLNLYNRHLPKTSEWWFIPGTDWPAYHYGKLFVWRTPSFSIDPDRLYMGYYVEHGVSIEVASQKKYVMNRRWYWHEFVRRAKEGELDVLTRQISRTSGCRIWVLFKAYEGNRPEETSGPNAPYDRLELSLAPRKTLLKLEQPGSEILSQLNQSRNVKELVSVLDEKDDFRFFWIDALVGIFPSDDSEEWSAQTMWARALEPWLPLVR
jgi:hypothetical protein